MGTMAVPFGTLTLWPRTTMSSKWTLPLARPRIIKFEVGATCVVTRGQNQGRIGTITGREKHIGSFEIVHIKDSKGRSFATRIGNVFVLAQKDEDPIVSIPRGKGVRA